MFTPTKKSLEELWFEFIWKNWRWYFNKKWITQITYDNWIFYYFPQSIEDIQILIKLLTPPNNN